MSHVSGYRVHRLAELVPALGRVHVFEAADFLTAAGSNSPA